MLSVDATNVEVRFLLQRLWRGWVGLFDHDVPQ